MASIPTQAESRSRNLKASNISARVSELTIGALLILGLFTGAVAFAGLALNVIYMFSGTSGVNPAYAIVAVFLILAWRNAGYLGLDGFVLPRIRGMSGRIPLPASRPAIPVTSSAAEVVRASPVTAQHVRADGLHPRHRPGAAGLSRHRHSGGRPHTRLPARVEYISGNNAHSRREGARDCAGRLTRQEAWRRGARMDVSGPDP